MISVFLLYLVIIILLVALIVVVFRKEEAQQHLIKEMNDLTMQKKQNENRLEIVWETNKNLIARIKNINRQLQNIIEQEQDEKTIKSNLESIKIFVQNSLYIVQKNSQNQN